MKIILRIFKWILMLYLEVLHVKLFFVHSNITGGYMCIYILDYYDIFIFAYISNKNVLYIHV